MVPPKPSSPLLACGLAQLAHENVYLKDADVEVQLIERAEQAP